MSERLPLTALHVSLIIRDIVDLPTWNKNVSDCYDSLNVKNLNLITTRSASGIAFLGFLL